MGCLKIGEQRGLRYSLISFLHGFGCSGVFSLVPPNYQNSGPTQTFKPPAVHAPVASRAPRAGRRRRAVLKGRRWSQGPATPSTPTSGIGPAMEDSKRGIRGASRLQLPPPKKKVTWETWGRNLSNLSQLRRKAERLKTIVCVCFRKLRKRGLALEQGVQTSIALVW